MKPLTEVQTEFFAAAFRMIVPEAVLVGAACALFLLAVFLPRRGIAVGIGMLGIAGAALAAVVAGSREVDEFIRLGSQTDFPAASLAPFLPTGAALFVRWMALVAAGLLLLVAWPELKDDNASEYVACLLVVAAGTSLVGRANDLVSLFLALEMVSIPTYVLLYLPARTRAAQEAAVKYFLLSVLSSAVLLFGFSYLYGLTGATNMSAITAVLTANGAAAVGPLGALGAIMVIAGLGFRIAAVPFHFYAPDVYEGGPTGVVAQIAVIPKIVGFVALARVFGLINPPTVEVPFDAVESLIPLTLWVIAAVTMSVGNALALLQENLKRLFAYSGIAHSGYMLIGLLVASSLPANGAQQSGVDAVLMYLAAYSLMTIGTFAVLAYLSDSEKPITNVDDLAGLGESHPAAAIAMAICLFSLIGLPLTIGFAGKFLLFTSAFEVPTSNPMGGMARLLVVVAAVNAAAAAFYYLRAIGVMYLRPPLHAARTGGGLLPLAAAVICAVGVLVFGAYPQPLAQAAQQAAPVPGSVIK